MLFRRRRQVTNSDLLSSQDEDRLKKFEPKLFLVYDQHNFVESAMVDSSPFTRVPAAQSGRRVVADEGR